MKKYVFILMLIVLWSCNNSSSGMKFNRTLLAQEEGKSIYCYNFIWARDAELTFISQEENVCAGFDSSKDISFGKGAQAIYYEYLKDTLNLYTYGSKPIIPSNLNYNIKLINADLQLTDRLDSLVKEAKVKKIKFSNHIDVPCGVLNIIPIDPYNLKFR